MEIILYAGIAMIIFAILALGISIWAVFTQREKKYQALLIEHETQKKSIQTKLDNHKKDGGRK
jgi:uncharacterized protein HemX